MLKMYTYKVITGIVVFKEDSNAFIVHESVKNRIRIQKISIKIINTLK